MFLLEGLERVEQAHAVDHYHRPGLAGQTQVFVAVHATERIPIVAKLCMHRVDLGGRRMQGHQRLVFDHHIAASLGLLDPLTDDQHTLRRHRLEGAGQQAFTAVAAMPVRNALGRVRRGKPLLADIVALLARRKCQAHRNGQVHGLVIDRERLIGDAGTQPIRQFPDFLAGSAMSQDAESELQPDRGDILLVENTGDPGANPFLEIDHGDPTQLGIELRGLVDLHRHKGATTAGSGTCHCGKVGKEHGAANHAATHLRWSRPGVIGRTKRLVQMGQPAGDAAAQRGLADLGPRRDHQCRFSGAMQCSGNPLGTAAIGHQPTGIDPRQLPAFRKLFSRWNQQDDVALAHVHGHAQGQVAAFSVLGELRLG